MGDFSQKDVDDLLDKVKNPDERNATAAALSKVAAKAEGAAGPSLH
jgi:hypothetical protein